MARTPHPEADPRRRVAAAGRRSNPTPTTPSQDHGPGRRTGRQRTLLGVGVLVTTLALVIAAVAGWAAWTYLRVRRVDVQLDVATGGPRNYLVVGSDSRAGGDPDHPGTEAESRDPLADTIMIVRVDPDREAATVLSLPRDLWVTRPDGTEGRINAAYATGPQALIDTIRTNLDIPIHHYVEVDFQAFQEVVGAIGGVPMYFDTPMRDANSGLDITTSGCVVLDGTQALGFARSRHLRYLDPATGRYRYDGTGDLGRISRQQVFLRRVIDRATEQARGNPVVLERVVRAAASHVTLDRDLGIGDLLALGRRFQNFDSKQLVTLSLPVTPRTTSGGAQVVDLDDAAAAPILARFRDAESSTTASTVPRDEVHVAVFNSSGVGGLAGNVATVLRTQGYDVVEVGNGSDLGHPDEADTVVRYAPGHEADARTVVASLGHGSVAQADDLGGLDVAVFLGRSGAPTASGDGAGATSSATTSITTAPLATTTTVASSAPVGVVTGDPPAGVTCG